MESQQTKETDFQGLEIYVLSPRASSIRSLRQHIQDQAGPIVYALVVMAEGNHEDLLGDVSVAPLGVIAVKRTAILGKALNRAIDGLTGLSGGPPVARRLRRLRGKAEILDQIISPTVGRREWMKLTRHLEAIPRSITRISYVDDTSVLLARRVGVWLEVERICSMYS